MNHHNFIPRSIVAASIDIAFKIEGGQSRGRVMVKYFGHWGTICAQNWRDREAGVICKRLGHADGMAYIRHKDSTIRKPSPLLIGNVTCEGNESSLRDCSYDAQPRLRNCYGAHEAGVLCFNDTGR